MPTPEPSTIAVWETPHSERPPRSRIAQPSPCNSARSLPAKPVSAWRRSAKPALVPCGIVVLAFMLSALPGLERIAPLVESDYCYQLMAADRWFDGLGPTTLQPVAPNQPWTWSYDWGFLTQWPIGYPALVCLVRWAAGGTSLDAARIISILACAAALVGWFLWLGRCVPIGGTRWLVALVGAATAVPVASLMNPSTDAIVIAILPYLLMGTGDLVQHPVKLFMFSGAMGKRRLARTSVEGHGQTSLPMPPISLTTFLEAAPASPPDGRTNTRPSFNMTRATLLGLMAGSLFWIRYASVFVPAALIMFLLVERCRKRVGTSIVAGFLVASLVPIGLLILINNLLGPSSSTTAAFNLGSTIAPTFSPSSITEAWVTFTALGYFDHRPLARALLACWPMIAVAILGITSWRRRRDRVSRSTLDSSTVAWERMRTLPKHSKRAHDRESVTSHGFGRCGLLNGCVLVVALLMLVTATSLFGAKYHYVALERYYLPIRPMYFALFVMPLLAWRSRLLHAAVATAMLPLLLWTVQVDGIRAYERGIITQSKRSPYGMWARCFTPEPAALTAWLKARNHPGLVVVSNYHEYLALETGMVILPIPSDRTALEHGIERIAEQRNVDVQEVLFVMDPDNRWRSHWIADPHEVADMFDLKQTVVRFDDSDVRVFRYESMKAALTDATR